MRRASMIARSILATVGLLHGIAKMCKGAREDRPHRLVVIDDENGWRPRRSGRVVGPACRGAAIESDDMYDRSGQREVWRARQAATGAARRG